jgi:two-component system, NtrC family, response regulator HydG
VARRLALGDLAHALSIGQEASAAVAPRSGSELPPPLTLPPDDVIARVIKLGLPLSRSRELVVDDFERRYVQAVLDRHQGDATKAAQASGIARRYFQLLRARQAGKSGG